jgi:hypothetical protein
MSNITFPKAKVGDKIRLTGKSWTRIGIKMEDIVTVTSLGMRKGFENVPRFNVPGHYVDYDILTDLDDPDEDWGGELVDEPSETDPDHYKFPGGAEVIDITRHMDFLTGNAVKYLTRAGRKGDRLTDLKKALRYVEWAIEDTEK